MLFNWLCKYRVQFINNISVSDSKVGSEHEDIYRKSKKYEYKVYKWTGISNEAIESRKKL